MTMTNGFGRSETYVTKPRTYTHCGCILVVWLDVTTIIGLINIGARVCRALQFSSIKVQAFYSAHLARHHGRRNLVQLFDSRTDVGRVFSVENLPSRTVVQLKDADAKTRHVSASRLDVWNQCERPYATYPLP
jgi:hypothetical protein